MQDSGVIFIAKLAGCLCCGKASRKLRKGFKLLGSLIELAR